MFPAVPSCAQLLLRTPLVCVAKYLWERLKRMTYSDPENDELRNISNETNIFTTVPALYNAGFTGKEEVCRRVMKGLWERER